MDRRLNEFMDYLTKLHESFMKQNVDTSGYLFNILQNTVISSLFRV